MIMNIKLKIKKKPLDLTNLIGVVRISLELDVCDGGRSMFDDRESFELLDV